MYICNTIHNTHLTPNHDAILDSGCSYHTLRQDAPSEHRKTTQQVQICGTPTGNMMTASDTALIKHNDFPTKAITSHHYPDLKCKSLLSVGQFCDSGYSTVFTSKDAKVINEKTNEVVLTARRHQPTGLWVTSMEPTDKIANMANATQKLNRAVPFMSASNVYALRTQVDLIKYLHVACCSPNPDTWCKAIDQVFFATFPGLTTTLVRQQLPKSVASQKGT